ncbi:hypothetical protein LWS67_23325, partial [Bacillus atrophaeus]|uniref:hypothetical protein n=1 Tax=Bacillus atrophaeus TaxID=1452 RepID=UPI001EFC1A4F
QTLEDNEVEEISSAEDFAEAVNKQIHSMLDDRQKRIDEALNSGVSISDIQRCEKALEFFNSLQENDIIDESDKGEKLRKQLIYTDFINR